jgi:hypothetical protein
MRDNIRDLRKLEFQHAGKTRKEGRKEGQRMNNRKKKEWKKEEGEKEGWKRKEAKNEGTKGLSLTVHKTQFQIDKGS